MLRHSRHVRLTDSRDAFPAHRATRAAVAEGVVPGGVLFLKRALETPARQLAANSGVDGGKIGRAHV